MIVLRSALRLCVWLFGFNDKIFCIDNTLTPAFGTKQRKSYQFCLPQYLQARLGTAPRT